MSLLPLLGNSRSSNSADLAHNVSKTTLAITDSPPHAHYNSSYSPAPTPLVHSNQLFPVSAPMKSPLFSKYGVSAPPQSH